jgi:hypothetical protein
MFDTRGYVHRVKQQPSSLAAQRPVHRGTPFYPISFLHVGARAHTRRPIAVAEMLFLMVELWQIRCVVDDESLPTNHQAYTICSSVCESVPQAFRPLSLNYCSSSPSRQSPKLSKREWFVRIALHYIFWYVMDEIPPLTNQFYNRP